LKKSFALSRSFSSDGFLLTGCLTLASFLSIVTIKKTQTKNFTVQSITLGSKSEVMSVKIRSIIAANCSLPLETKNVYKKVVGIMSLAKCIS
jgi:hypothetical protein